MRQTLVTQWLVKEDVLIFWRLFSLNELRILDAIASVVTHKNGRNLG